MQPADRDDGIMAAQVAQVTDTDGASLVQTVIPGVTDSGDDDTRLGTTGDRVESGGDGTAVCGRACAAVCADAAGSTSDDPTDAGSDGSDTSADAIAGAYDHDEGFDNKHTGLRQSPNQGFTQSHCSTGSATDANVGGTGNHHHSFSQPSSRAQDSNSHRDSIFDGINQCIDGDVMWIESSKKDFKPWPGVVFRSWDCLEKVCMLCVCV